MARAPDTVHRVRRVALAVAGVRDVAQALDWRQSLREALDDGFLPALGEAFDAVARQRRLGARTLRLPRLAVHLRLSDPRAASAALRAAVEAALHDASAAAGEADSGLQSPQQRTEEALRQFLLGGRLPWADDPPGDDIDATIDSLRALAQAWFDRLRAEPAADEPVWLDRRLVCSEAALSRWASFVEAAPDRLAPPSTTVGGTGLGSLQTPASHDRVAPAAVLETAAGRLEWLQRRLAALRTAPEGKAGAGTGCVMPTGPVTSSVEPLVTDRSPAAPSLALRARGPREVGAPHAAAFATDPDDADAARWLAHDAGLVLLHPYLPTLLGAIGAVDDAAVVPTRLRADALPRAAALLHWLVSGRERVHEFELTLCKLLLGVAPDEPLLLDAEAASPTEAMRDEGRALLEAVISHWAALGSTGVESLRLAFLQRDGVLSRGDGGWQLRVADEAFDVLLARLPWSIAIVRLPWMREPLHVQWGSA